VCDGGGNCVTTPAIGGNRIDRKPPTVDITTPQPDAVYLLNQRVVGAFACADGGSGVASCTGSSASGRPVTTSSVGRAEFSVAAADQATNSQTVSVPYAVTYAVELLDDASAVVREEEILHLALRIADAHGANQSNPSVTLRARGIVSLDGATRVDVTEAVRFDARSSVYPIDLKTAGLSSGTYRLRLDADGDPVAHDVSFRVR
jgi:hypothetical protein